MASAGSAGLRPHVSFFDVPVVTEGVPGMRAAVRHSRDRLTAALAHTRSLSWFTADS
jgi:hypothetical protein